MIEVYRSVLSDLQPDAVAQASAEIRQIGRLYTETRPSLLGRFLVNRNHAGSEHSGWLLQFHASGYIREKAFQELSDPPQSAFEFVAVVYRMNDWVAQVREAAFAYAQRLFPLTEPKIVATAALFLFRQAGHLARWDRRAARLVEETLYHDKVLEILKAHLLQVTDGPVVRVLRSALRRPDLDSFLPELALNAKSAAIRSCAADAVLNRRACWAEGYKRVWVNKAYGVSRRVADLRHRSLSVTVNIRKHMDLAAQDRSAQVRRVAASLLSEQYAKPLPWHANIAERLRQDRNLSIATRMAFYFRKRAEAEA